MLCQPPLLLLRDVWVRHYPIECLRDTPRLSGIEEESTLADEFPMGWDIGGHHGTTHSQGLDHW